VCVHALLASVKIISLPSHDFFHISLTLSQPAQYSHPSQLTKKTAFRFSLRLCGVQKCRLDASFLSKQVLGKGVCYNKQASRCDVWRQKCHPRRMTSPEGKIEWSVPRQQIRGAKEEPYRGAGPWPQRAGSKTSFSFFKCFWVCWWECVCA